MRGKRLRQFLRLCLIMSAKKRTAWIRKHKVFAGMGEHCMIMDRIIPLYPELIRFGNNIYVASNVHFVTHDVTHCVLNNLKSVREKGVRIKEKLGCIEIDDNVFIGSGTRILYDVKIGENCIIGADSLINRDVPSNSVVAGVPAKVIGSFEDFANKRINAVVYPDEFRSQRESISGAFAEYLWNEFDRKRG